MDCPKADDEWLLPVNMLNGYEVNFLLTVWADVIQSIETYCSFTLNSYHSDGCVVLDDIILKRASNIGQNIRNTLSVMQFSSTTTQLK